MNVEQRHQKSQERFTSPPSATSVDFLWQHISAFANKLMSEGKALLMSPKLYVNVLPAKHCVEGLCTIQFSILLILLLSFFEISSSVESYLQRAQNLF